MSWTFVDYTISVILWCRNLYRIMQMKSFLEHAIVNGLIILHVRFRWPLHVHNENVSKRFDLTVFIRETWSWIWMTRPTLTLRSTCVVWRNPPTLPWNQIMYPTPNSISSAGEATQFGELKFTLQILINWWFYSYEF